MGRRLGVLLTTCALTAKLAAATTGLPRVAANDYWLLNLTLWCRPLGNNFDFSVSVYNVLGHKYAYPVGDEYWANSGPLMEFSGREFRAKFTYRF